MCYNKANNHMFADPQPREGVLSEMSYDVARARDLLMQIRELKMFDQIFTDGERGSIQHLIEMTTTRNGSIKELQKQFV